MPSNLKLGRLISKVRVVNGRPMAQNSREADIETIKTKMVQKKVLPEACAQTKDIQMVSDNLLFGLNVTIDKKSDRYFSLISTETDTEVIENPNIIDNIKWDELENEYVSAIDKFPEATDNFFSLDAPLSNPEQAQRDKSMEKAAIKDTIGITSDLLDYNLRNIRTGILPQFKS